MTNLTLKHSIGITQISIETEFDFSALKHEYTGLRVGLIDSNLLSVLRKKSMSNILTILDHIIEIPEGEPSKSFEQYQLVVSQLFDCKADRSATIFAIGGGVTGDLSGFVAATFLRGIRYVQVPTTLLSQIDSSIGGKTGINHPRGKNLLGAFYQPEQIIIDPNFLKSLPNREVISALGELVKYTILNSAEQFDRLSDYLQRHSPKDLLDRDFDFLVEWIVYGVRSKVEVVEKDEREKNIRAFLNLGHTFGHAIEKYYGYENIRHGEAVSVGMLFVSYLSNRLNILSHSDLEKISDCLVRLIPSDGKTKSWNLDEILSYLTVDKKMNNGKLRWIIPHSIGHCEWLDHNDFDFIRSTAISFHREYLKW